MAAKTRFVLSLALISWGALACSGQQKDPNVGGDGASDAAPESEPATGGSEAPSVSGFSTEADQCSGTPCSVNAECCEGYVCGFDPDLSRVQRYCLGG